MPDLLNPRTSWRELACGVCGAPRTAIDDAQFIACEFCGAVYDVSARHWFDPQKQTEAFARSKAAAFWASKAAGRFARLGAELAQLPPADPMFLARSEEYHSLYALLYPDRVPATTPKARAAWAKQAAATDVVVRTDSHIARLFDDLNDALRGFGNSAASADEVVATAATAVARATRAYGALQSHPSLAGLFPAPPAAYARSAVRTSLLTMLPTLRDPNVYPRVAVEVFGDRDGIARDCAHCGAPLARHDLDLDRCGHCGSVIERSVDDPWIASRVALFRATLDERHRRNELDTYVTALAAFSFVGSFAEAGRDRVAAYLRRAMPWLPGEALQLAARLYRDMLGDPERAIFDEVIAMPWVTMLDERPAPPPTPPRALIGAFDAEAWLEKSRVLWSHAAHRDDPVLAALVIAIVDVLVAPVEARPPITAALVLRFFDEVLADVPRATQAARLAVGAMGYGDGPAGDLVRAIASAYG